MSGFAPAAAAPLQPLPTTISTEALLQDAQNAAAGAAGQGELPTPPGSAKKGGRKDKSVQCAYCNMTFNKKEHLQRHERTHTLDRPYVCEFPDCGKTFARRDTLTRHSRLHAVKPEGLPEGTVPAPKPARSHPQPAGGSSAPKKRKARHPLSGSAAKRAAGSASESEYILKSARNSVGNVSSSPAFLSASGGSGSGTSLDRLDDGDHNMDMDHLQSPISPATDETDMKDVIEQPTPMGLTTATLLYGMAWGEQTHPPSSIVEPISSLAPSAADVAISRNNMGGSSLGLDIPMPQHVFSGVDMSGQAASSTNVPSFVQAVQSGFKIFPAQGAESSAAGVDKPGHHFQHTFPSASQQQSNQPSQSFLAGGPVTSDAGSPYATQLFPQGGGGGNADLTGFSRSFSPIERPTSSNSSASYLYSSAASEPSSLASSVQSLAASLPPTFEGDIYNPYYYDHALRAFKHNTAYMQALTMEQNFMDIAMRLQSEYAHGDKNGSQELPVEDFLQWPSREQSPAIGSVGLSPESGWTNSSNSPDAASPFFDLNDYDGTPATLFADKTVTAVNTTNNAQSPIASLEEWLLRQNNDGLYD